MSQIRSTTRSPGVDVAARDVEIMRGLFESRVMNLWHIAALYFDGRSEAAKKRTQKLKHARLIAERRRDHYAPSILFLTRCGTEELFRGGHVEDYPRLTAAKLAKRMAVSPLTLRHELDCMDVKTTLTVAVRARPGLAIPMCSTWPLLHQFPAYTSRGERVLVKPDGFIRIAGADGEHCYFLEVDRSTESHEVLAERAHCYVDHYRRGGFAVRNGGRKEEFAAYPFRIIMIFRNAERRNNAAARLLQNRPPILTQAILTTMEEFLADPLSPIFIQPIDYRDAVRGTEFDVERFRIPQTYRRRSEREALVQERAARCRLLGI